MNKLTRKTRGLTLAELLVAATLLAVAAVPVISALSRGIGLALDIEHRTTATLLAQKEMENALATGARDFSIYLAKTSQPLGGNYLVTITVSVSGLKKTFSVEVGWDRDHNGQLTSDEVLTTLTSIATDMGG